MNNVIEQLKQAVEISPDNIPLRLHLAEMMLQENMLTEASEQYSTVLKRDHKTQRHSQGLPTVIINKISIPLQLFYLNSCSKCMH